MGVTHWWGLFRLMGMIGSQSVTDAEATYRRLSPELMRYATGLVGPFDASDVVSEACLRAFTSSGWADVTNERAYLYRTVFHVAADIRRTALSRRVREHKAATPVAVTDPELDFDVLDAVSRLSVAQRSVVVLTYWADLAPGDVGEYMGISSGSVKRHLARARRHLRGRLG